MTLQLTIVVPAFNEARRLAGGMGRFDAAVREGAVDLERTEVLLIDDGSDDGTAETARKLLAPLPHHRVVSLPANKGKGAAVRAGVALARGPAVAFMDADMAIDPRAVVLLLESLEENDVVIGSRALRDSMVETTYAVRTLMGLLFNKLVTTGTGLSLRDTQCGFKAFRTPAARLLFHLVDIDRFAFDVEILTTADKLGLRIAEIPVHWKHVEGSTIHPWHDSLLMLADVYWSRLGLRSVPAVPAITVRARTDRAAAGTGTPVGERITAAIAGTVPTTAPVVITAGSATTVALPLIEEREVALAFSALRAELGDLEVSRRDLTLDSLRRLAPLAGALRSPGTAEGAA